MDNGEPVPVNLVVVSQPGGVVLNWEQTSSAVSYRVYRDGHEVGSFINGTAWTDTEVSENETYKYFVIGCNANEECSQPSASQSVTYDFTTPIGAGGSTECSVFSGSTANAIPTNVSLDDNDLLTWVPPVNSVKWNVYRNDVYEYTITNGSPSYAVENHVVGNEYYVTAIYPDGSISSPSNLANSVTAPLDCAVIEAANLGLTTANLTLLATLTQTEADLEQAQIDLAAAIAGNSTAQDVLDAQAAQAAAEAALATAEADLAAALLANTGTAQDILDAQALQAAAEADLATAEGTIIGLEADVATAEAAQIAAETAQANAEAAQLQAEADLLTAQQAETAALAALATAQADLATCEADLATTEQAALLVATDLATAQADLATAQADLAACQLLIP